LTITYAPAIVGLSRKRSARRRVEAHGGADQRVWQWGKVVETFNKATTGLSLRAGILRDFYKASDAGVFRAELFVEDFQGPLQAKLVAVGA
jgi:hypothetical protein